MSYSVSDEWLHEPWNAPAGSVLELVRGTSFSRTWTFEDSSGQSVDLTTGYSAQLIMKRRPSETDTVLTAQSGGGLALDALGNVTLSLTPLQTASLTAGTLVFELFVTDPNGGVTRLDYGRVTISI